MQPKKVGFVGWRGMVGSVLLSRMQEEGDFKPELWSPFFFSTSQAGHPGPRIKGYPPQALKDAYVLSELEKMDTIVSCQGSEYTRHIQPKLRDRQWRGYWVDAASELRTHSESTIILDPVNADQIHLNLKAGNRDFIVGNCTVSLMLMAVAGLIKADLVEWISTMTYQAASGSGAQCMRELIQQMHCISDPSSIDLTSDSILDIERSITASMRSADFPTQEFGFPLAGSLLPWIDKEVELGQSREEWKGQVEANKILGYPEGTLKVDGTCVRVSSLRCHSQGLTIKLKRAIAVEAISEILSASNQWVELIPNTREASLKQLTPAAVSASLTVAVGRIRKMTLGDQYLSVFTVGDQLLWGAAEPLRRMLTILLN